MGNTILAKGVNHILAKRDNSAWPKGAKLSGFSRGYAIAYFANRIPIYNAISATKVDIDISTLTQVGI